MPENRWNQDVHLYPADRWFAWVERLFPSSVQPNHLTVLRFILVPFVAFALHRQAYAIGIPLFLFAAATDWLDGLLARRRKQITRWGVTFDPVADKLLVGATLFVVVFENVNVVLGSALLVVETIAIILTLHAHRNGKARPANGWGKAKMIFEVVGIALLLIALWLGIDLLVTLSAGTLAVALVSALVSASLRGS